VPSPPTEPRRKKRERSAVHLIPRVTPRMPHAGAVPCEGTNPLALKAVIVRGLNGSTATQTDHRGGGGQQSGDMTHNTEKEKV